MPTPARVPAPARASALPRPGIVLVKCIDETLELPAAQACLLVKRMPSFANLPANIVLQALPYLELKRPPTNAGKHIALAAMEHGWDQHAEVQTCMSMGYPRARIFRACQALATKSKLHRGRLPPNLSLNRLLDATESVKEMPETDAEIEWALEQVRRNGASDAGGGEVSGIGGRLASAAMHGKVIRRSRASTGDNNGRSANQRVLELEAQLGEMCTDLENALQCSITMEVCKDPVVAPSGHVYERSKILQWIRMHGNDPQTRARLKATQLYRIRSVADLGEKYRKRGLIE